MTTKTTVPITLKRMCITAVRFEFVFVPIVERSAVTQVPIFWPKIIYTANESLKYAYACRGALYNARNSGAYEYAYKRIVRIYNPIAENLGILKRIHGVLHKLHTHKQHAETGECLPDIFQRILFGKKNHKCAYKYSYRSYPGKIQRNKNACGCGTDICTHNNAYRLR